MRASSIAGLMFATVLSATIPVSFYPSVLVARTRVRGLQVSLGSTHTYAETWIE